LRHAGGVDRNIMSRPKPAISDVGGKKAVI
jgi:hypothetical protein